MTTPDHILPPPLRDDGPLETMARAIADGLSDFGGEPRATLAEWQRATAGEAGEMFAMQAQAAVTALTEAGYAIVPVEPTAAMECAMEDAMCASDQCCCDHLAIYRAALGPIDTKEGE